MTRNLVASIALATATVLAAGSGSLRAQSQQGQQPQGQRQKPDDQQAFRFRTGVELINVTATVTDQAAGSSPGCGRTTSASIKTTRSSRSRISTPSEYRSASASHSIPAAAWSAKRWPPRETR
jgi:hypothetical protein